MMFLKIIKSLTGKILLPAALWAGSTMASFAQYTIEKVEPPSWWVGMKNNQVELLVYGPSIADLAPKVKDASVTIRSVSTVANPSYLFILLEFDREMESRSFKIYFDKNGSTMASYNYQLFAREPGSAERKGFGNADVICLVTPDRFANGDPSNDNMPGYPEQANRSDKDGRHGGDLKGITDHLGYFAGMGYTQVWLNPVLENNMPRTSYHGYAITDYYKVDPRYGTNEEYRAMSRAMKEKGIGLIMDMVANHCGSEHWWMMDLPSADWINNGGEFISTNHRRSTVQDPYVSDRDRRLFPEGWFVESMPDLNQKNPHLARYIIQNSVWWIEYAGLSGIRQDTYSYPDKDFMTEWSCAIMEEYPDFSIVGEEWSENPAIVSYWQKGKSNPDGYTSCLGSLMDFPLQFALVQGLTQSDAYHKDGLIRMYEMLANDFLYPDPYNLVIFPDNHDMSRFYTQVHEDFDLFKMGIAYILTMRGIPQIYYGTEILMKNPGTDAHGVIRSDFPGGWAGDAVNAFTGMGLTARQVEAREYITKLINWRKTKTCLHDGSLVHFSPEAGTYVYFRMDNNGKVMVIFNKNDQAMGFDCSARYADIIGYAKEAKDVVTGETVNLGNVIVPSRSSLILEF